MQSIEVLLYKLKNDADSVFDVNAHMRYLRTKFKTGTNQMFEIREKHVTIKEQWVGQLKNIRGFGQSVCYKNRGV